MKKTNNIILTVLLFLLVINTIIFAIQFNQLNFINNIIPLAINIILLIIIGSSIYFGYRCLFEFLKNKFIIILITIAILLNSILLTFNIFTNILDKAMVKITNNNTVYSSTIIVLKDSNINSIDDLNNNKIGWSDNELDYENYLLVHNILEKKDKLNNNEFYKYDDYLRAINDLLNKNIDALVISSSYLTLYSEYFEDINSKVKTITDNIEVVVKNEAEKKATIKSSEEPFTILIIGADTLYGGYNADVQILMTINPKTKKIVQVDVVRDTYTYNMDTKKMDKITHSGWAGSSNVVATVENLFDVKIDYYIKLNFNSVVDLVNMMGGITIDVPYTFHGDRFGTYVIYPGIRKLTGEETLMLARTRQMAGSNLQSRGRMQMKIIETVTKQIDSDFIINNFFKLLDVAANNIETNISKSDMYYYIQKYASIKNEFTFESNTLYGYNSSYYHEGMGKTLYTYVPDESSLSQLSNKLKDNLN